MKTIAAVARTYPGQITIIQTMNGLLAFTKDNNIDADLENKLAKIYEKYQNKELTKQEMNHQVDQLMNAGVSSEAHK